MTIGVIVLSRSVVRPFTGKQIEAMPHPPILEVNAACSRFAAHPQVTRRLIALSRRSGAQGGARRDLHAPATRVAGVIFGSPSRDAGY